jgi:hypothetical protein
MPTKAGPPERLYGSLDAADELDWAVLYFDISNFDEDSHPRPA